MTIEPAPIQVVEEEQSIMEPQAKKEMSPAIHNLIKLLARIAVDKYVEELKGERPPFKVPDKS